MLGIGWTEMLVIGVIALIVIGPKELPTLMNKIGRFAGTVRRMGADFQRELNKTTGLDEVRNLRNSITQPLKATTDSIRREFNTTGAGGKVEPSGALKPADPKAESVVEEIHAAAGMTPPKSQAEAMREAVGKGLAASAAGKGTTAAEPPAAQTAAAAEVADAPRVKAARVSKPKAAPKSAAAKTGAAAKTVAAAPAATATPATTETTARPMARRKPEAAAKPDVAAEPAKPAAAPRKPAAPRKTAKKRGPDPGNT